MIERPSPAKDADAYRTIGEAAEELKLPQHVLRFWETRFPQVKPLKRAGGRRFYRPEDVALLQAIKTLLYGQGYTIKGVQRMLQEQGHRSVAAGLAPTPAAVPTRAPPPDADPTPARAAAGDGAAHPGFVPRPASPALESLPLRPVPSGPGGRAAMVARLEAVVSDLAECGALLEAARATR